MIALPTKFQFDHFDFKQLDRQGNIALFEKSKPGGSKSWEVVIIQKMGEHTWPNGKVSSAHEYMPHSDHWGTLGWTLQTKDRAFEKFKELT